ncbi:hypothetical protein [Tuwongella immobilis]|uniref:hypothetical protein n=1 Tax=Tuwongella immobilis TaxID=692036 RepID=UPI0013A6E16A|nr:hypothetical protein [Tuwongella immobilis]
MTIQNVLSRWESGTPMQAGEELFKSLEANVRPLWAAGILSLVYNRSRFQQPVIDEAIQIARTPSLWAEGHRLFDRIRSLTLRLDGDDDLGLSGDSKLLLGHVVSLAELVAKVTYNASDPADPFDEDSGWWIVECLRGFVDHVWTDKDFSAAAWEALARYSQRQA